MVVVQGWSIVVVVLLYFRTEGWAQDPTPDPEPGPEPPAEPSPPPPPPPSAVEGNGNEGNQAKGFLVPSEMGDDVDKFSYESEEYLVINRKRRWRSARLLCRMDYKGKLAIIDDTKKALFLAEALSETNLAMDALWIAGRRLGNSTDWEWIDKNSTKPIDPELVKTFSKVSEVEADNRDCLAFARLDHDLPDYRELACNAERAVLCQRRRGGGDINSTHPGWIKLGKREYKIFAEQTTYDRATTKCFEHHPEAQLAVITNFDHSQLLGRYLLIGRPSLENAWIGAKWIESKYAFEPEPIDLANTSTSGGDGPWPPWRKDHIQKIGGCVLLDRHLANITLFVEARCERNRGYICYKMISNVTDEESHTDVIIGENGYRLHFFKRPWDSARDYCLNTYNDYGAFLAEIRTAEVKTDLLYVMGENKTTVQHIWLGAKFSSVDPVGWIWEKDKSTVNDGLLDWVMNTTYNEEAEQLNICLDMDRENHLTALHYGADCTANQNFICYFTRQKLEELIEYERLHTT